MRRIGYFLAVAVSIFLFDGCSGANHDKHDDEAPVVQDLKIETDSPPASDAADSDAPSDE